MPTKAEESLVSQPPGVVQASAPPVYAATETTVSVQSGNPGLPPPEYHSAVAYDGTFSSFAAAASGLFCLKVFVVLKYFLTFDGDESNKTCNFLVSSGVQRCYQLNYEVGCYRLRQQGMLELILNFSKLVIPNNPLILPFVVWPQYLRNL